MNTIYISGFESPRAFNVLYFYRPKSSFDSRLTIRKLSWELTNRIVAESGIGFQSVIALSTGWKPMPLFYGLDSLKQRVGVVYVFIGFEVVDWRGRFTSRGPSRSFRDLIRSGVVERPRDEIAFFVKIDKQFNSLLGGIEGLISKLQTGDAFLVLLQ